MFSDVHLVPNLRRIPAAAAVYRSSAPAGEPDLSELGLRTIIDLREPSEAAAAPVYASAGCRLVPVPLYAGPVPVVQELSKVYRMLLKERGVALVAALRQISLALPNPVLVHCKAGKDRTGLVIALLLAAGGIAREIILDDYARSATALGEDYARGVREELQRQLGAEHPLLHVALELHLSSPARALDESLNQLVHEYGSVANYLLAQGLESAHVHRLRTAVNPQKPVGQ